MFLNRCRTGVYVSDITSLHCPDSSCRAHQLGQSPLSRKVGGFFLARRLVRQSRYSASLNLFPTVHHESIPMRTYIIAFLFPVLVSGCTAVSIAGSAVSVGASAVSVGASAVGVAVDVAGAGVKAVVGGSSEGK